MPATSLHGDLSRTRRALVLVCVALLASAAPAEEIEVNLEGLRGELEDNARAVLEIAAAARQDQGLSPARIRALHEEAPDQIRRALEPFGHYRPAIDASLAHEGEEWTATYRVEPGPQVRVRGVDVQVTGPGAEDPGFARRVREFPLQQGEPLLHARYEEGKGTFPAYAASHGYLDGRFEQAEVRVDTEAGSADVVLRYASGPRFRYGEVHFRQERTAVDPDLLEDFVPFAGGEPIDLTELRALQGSLGQSPWFSHVEVRAERKMASGLEVPIVVDLVPAKPRFWRVAAGYGTDTGPRFSVGLDLRRIGHEGHRAESDILVSGIERSAAVRYLVPGRNAATDVWTGTTGYREVDSDATQSRTAILGGALTRRLGRWNQTLGLRWQREDFEVGVDQGVSTLLFPEISWARIDADDPIYPLHGRRLELRLLGADEAVVSDASFVQAVGQVRLVRSLGAELRVHGRLDVGSTATADFHALPATFRFFAGGDRSVRGYSYQALSPLDATGTPSGGEVLLTTNLEVDWLPIERWGRWGIAVFQDWGNAAADFGSLDLKRGAGGGLRWVSPIGMVRADVAWALDEPGRPTRFHLSIGPDL